MQPHDHSSLYPKAKVAQEAKPSRKTWLLILAVGLLSVLAGLAIGKLLASSPYSPSAIFQFSGRYSWAVILGFAFSIFPHILLHEAGHALAGRLVGMQLLIAGIGSWRIQKMDGRWQSYRLEDVAGVAGFAAMTPTQDQATSRTALVVFTLGGVVANFATAVLLWWLRPDAASSPVLHALIIGAILQALLLGFINLLPLASQGWLSDGKQLLSMLREPEEAARYLTLQRIGALSLAAVRPRDWPESIRPPPSTENSPSVIARLLDICHAQWRIDSRQQLDDVAFWQRIVDHHSELGDGYRQYAAVAMAQYTARQLHDADLLEAWLEHCHGGLIDLAPQRAVIAAHLAALQGKSDKLPKLIQQARELLPRTADPASRLLLKEALDTLEAQPEATAIV